MEILPGVHSLPAADKGTVFAERMPPNVYLIVGDRSAIIDSGYDHEEPLKFRLKYLDDIGKDKVDYIIITHFHQDHLGGASKIKQAKGGDIVMHSLDASESNKALSPLKVEKVVQEGDVLDLGGGVHLEFIHTPGHSPGHMCIYLREKRLLFTGDHVLGAGTTGINTQHGDMAAYIESLKKLLAYDIQMILPGHGPLVREPKKKIKELIQHRMDREEQVLGLLKAGVHTVEEMLSSIYPELDQGLWGNARAQIRAHLVKLQREGRVKPLKEGESYALV